MLIHSGDSDINSLFELKDFIKWFSSLNIEDCIYVAGNHDFFIEKNYNFCKNFFEENNIIYLQNDLVKIKGLRIYGSPTTPTFYNWAFMYSRGEQIAEEWRRIPDNLDILITHGPPNGILDLTRRSLEHAGCEELLKKVQLTKPSYHLFGHIHEGYGRYETEDTIFLNSAMVCDRYEEIRKPQVFTINER